MNQKIIIIGDTHGNFEIIEKIFQKENASGEVVAILQAEILECMMKILLANGMKPQKNIQEDLRSGK